MASHTGRRKFLAALGGAAVAWPLLVRAEQVGGLRHIGILMNLAAEDPESQARIRTFLQGLGELGWIEGRNIRIETRWAAADADAFANTQQNSSLLPLMSF
jgi:putative tryptophan/tyrosine transport system substrate-binding protein